MGVPTCCGNTGANTAQGVCLRLPLLPTLEVFRCVRRRPELQSVPQEWIKHTWREYRLRVDPLDLHSTSSPSLRPACCASRGGRDSRRIQDQRASCLVLVVRARKPAHHEICSRVDSIQNLEFALNRSPYIAPASRRQSCTRSSCPAQHNILTLFTGTRHLKHRQRPARQRCGRTLEARAG